MATYSGTPKTWTAGETLLASDFNAEIRDPIAALAGAWNSYTPTLQQGAVVSATVNYAKYIRMGKLVIGTVKVTATSAGTAGQAVVIYLPVTAATSAIVVGAATIYDSSAVTSDTGAAYLESTTTASAVTDASTSDRWGGTPNIALASGDIVHMQFMYEAA